MITIFFRKMENVLYKLASRTTDFIDVTTFKLINCARIRMTRNSVIR